MEWKRGQLVRSKQGRDQGKFYLLIAEEGDYCLLCDGDKMPLSRLKRKNKKHIEGTKIVAGSVREKLLTEQMPTDVEIKRFLKERQTETGVSEVKHV